MLTVVETPGYLRRAEHLLDVRQRAGIVDMVAASPSIGDLIPGTGGLRKVRIALQGRGKRGGARLITFFHDPAMPVFLITIYGKNEQDDLTDDEKRQARLLTDAIRAQYGR